MPVGAGRRTLLLRLLHSHGPPTDHYLIAPLSRIDRDEVLGLVRDKKYFVLHAPRQTGKTSALLALAEVLNERGYGCVYVTVETARTARDDVQRAMRTVLAMLAHAAGAALGDRFLRDAWAVVNALAHGTCFKNRALRQDRARTVTAGDVAAVREDLIVNRVTHLDYLADKLREDRVRRVIEPMLSGTRRHAFTDRDMTYARDLGLVARDAPLRVANPIYAEVLPRELAWVAQETLDVPSLRYVRRTAAWTPSC